MATMGMSYHYWRYSIVLLLLFCRLAVISIATLPISGLDPQLTPLLEKIATIDDDTSVDDDIKSNLWRKIGKIQLDAGEYAEAQQIFRHGAMRCPFDKRLVHHVQVFSTFHGPCQDTKLSKTAPPPPLLEAPASSGRTEANPFLSLEVPIDAIPIAVLNWRSENSCDVQKRTRLIHASKEPLLSKEICEFLISSAQQTAKERGWTTDRHKQAPTCDIPLFDLPHNAQLLCRRLFHETLFPLLASTVSPEIEVDPKKLRIQDCFVVRYDASNSDGPGYLSLRPHEDESLLSLTIALNDMSEYEDGGLFIQATGDLLNGDAGTVLCFPGALVHAGYPISKGTRWILTVFIYVDENQSGKDPGYTLAAVESIMKEKIWSKKP